MRDTFFYLFLAAVLLVGSAGAQRNSSAQAKRFLDQGVAKHDGGECAEAITLYTKALEHQPRHAQALTYRGQCYYQINDIEKALADLSAAIKLDPKVDEAYRSRGDLYSGIGKYREAVADYTTVLRLTPDDHDTLMARADAYRELGDENRAAADEKKADEVWEKIVADPDTIPPAGPFTVTMIRPKLLTEAELIDSYVVDSTGSARIVSGDAEERRESAKQEISRLDAIIKANASFAGAYFERGNARVELGETQAAITDYSKAIDLDPKFYKAFNNRAVACARAGNYERAIADLARAMTYEPQEQHRHYNFALVLFNKGSHQLAVNILDGYLNRNEGAFRAHQLRALAYRKLGKTAEANADEAAAKRLVEGR